MLHRLLQYIHDWRESRWRDRTEKRLAELLRARYGQMSAQSQNELLMIFFSGQEDTRIPHSIDSIIEYSDEQMEGRHDYIQWVYPTSKPSYTHPDSPTIDAKFARLLFDNKAACRNYCRTCRRFLHYLNFDCKGDGTISQLSDRSKDFYLLPAHNHLRITRALDSLRDTGHPQCSNALYAALMNALRLAPPHVVSQTTLDYWSATQSTE